MLRQYLNQPQVEKAEAPRPPVPRKIVVPLASRTIQPGTQISLDDIALYRMTRDEIRKSIKLSAFMTNPDQIIGKFARKLISKDQPFLTEDFYPDGNRPGIAQRIPAGARAITVMMDPTSALMGFAGPGQRVDVLFHYGKTSELSEEATPGSDRQGYYPPHFVFNPPKLRDYYGRGLNGNHASGGANADQGLQSATVTLVQDAEIMAIGQNSIPTQTANGLADDEQVPVTLAVSPRQAELLRVAGGHGELSLTLRSPSDQTEVALLDPVTLDEIISVKQRNHEMVIHRGKNVSTLNFAGGSRILRKNFNPQVLTDVTSDPTDRQSPLPAINIVAPYSLWPYKSEFPAKPAAGSGTKPMLEGSSR